MIFYVPTGEAVGPAAVAVVEEHAICSRTFHAAAFGGPPPATGIVGEAGDAAELEPHVQDVLEDFNWDNPKTLRDFIRLEQKVLAKQATPAEADRYRMMKRDQHSRIFAERQLRDYAEVQRLRKLSEKLAEVQQYLRPLEI